MTRVVAPLLEFAADRSSSNSGGCGCGSGGCRAGWRGRQGSCRRSWSACWGRAWRGRRAGRPGCRSSGSADAASRRFRSSPSMLPVRSMMTTTSSGLNGASPHGPLQAADTMEPVDPLLTPTARPNENWVVITPLIWTTVLHLSPRSGRQMELRVGPASMKSVETEPACVPAPSPGCRRRECRRAAVLRPQRRSHIGTRCSSHCCRQCMKRCGRSSNRPPRPSVGRVRSPWPSPPPASRRQASERRRRAPRHPWHRSAFAGCFGADRHRRRGPVKAMMTTMTNANRTINLARLVVTPSVPRNSFGHLESARLFQDHLDGRTHGDTRAEQQREERVMGVSNGDLDRIARP